MSASLLRPLWQCSPLAAAKRGLLACALLACPYGPALAATPPATPLGPLTLGQAEGLASAHDPILQAQEAARAIGQLTRASHTGSLYPQVNFETSYTSPPNFSGQNYTSNAALQAEIANPWIWRADQALLDINDELLTAEQAAQRQELLRDVRLQYFAVAYHHAKHLLRKEALDLLGAFKNMAEKRFANGFINDGDLLRTKIQYDEQQADLSSNELSCHSEQHKLLALMGLTSANEAMVAKLATPMHFDLDGPLWSAAGLSSLQEQQKAIVLRSSALASDGAELAMRKSWHAIWSPQLRLGASYPLGAPELARPTYTASLSWNLFAGGRDTNTHHTAVLEKSKLQAQHLKNQQEYELTGHGLIAELLALKERLQTQNKMVKAWQELATQSRQRFVQGLISSRDVNEDLATLLQQREKNLDILYEIAGKIINLAFVFKNPGLLTQAIK